MSRAWRRPEIGTRLVAVVALLGFALGNIGGLIHQATTRHVQCPEHGDLMHEGEPDADAPALAARDGAGDRSGLSSPAAAATTTAKPPASAPRHGHDHCYIGSQARERMAAPSLEAPRDCAPPPAPAVVALAHDPGAAARSLYRTAPKTSPPV
ncbi:MAG TPA: hypothetical protein VKB80_22435 [Kofleriaceae bacterium]|nr:hypothetical protein [Kofleriaceae bacterium]